MSEIEKNEIYKNIKEKYTEQHIKKFESRIDNILEELALQNKRSLIIMGCAYLEEVCKNCIYETMTKEGIKKFNGNHKRELTFSLASTLLYAQDYISEDIFSLISYVRDIRNKFAHVPLLEESHMQNINDRTKKIRKLLDSRWTTRNIKRIQTIEGDDPQLYYILFENLMLGFMGLQMFIIPDQKLARLQFVKNQDFLRVKIDVGSFNEKSESYFEKKFE